MKLHWYGHACFMLESDMGSVVFDPYEVGAVPGLALPKLKAEAVLCSHGHHDHDYTQAVEISGHTTGIKLDTLHCFHDEVGGRKRGSNTIHILDAEGLRFVHLGDLGHELDESQIEKLGEVDVLMIPVGGYYTIDAGMAAELTKKIGAAVTIPMHYRGKGFGYDNIGTVDEYTAHFDKIVYSDSSVFEPGTIEKGSILVLSCPLE